MFRELIPIFVILSADIFK